MGDELTGSHKIVRKVVENGQRLVFSIAKATNSFGLFYQEIVPDAGNADMAREICNLLNKKEREDRESLEDPMKKIRENQCTFHWVVPSIGHLRCQEKIFEADHGPYHTWVNQADTKQPNQFVKVGNEQEFEHGWL